MKAARTAAAKGNANEAIGEWKGADAAWVKREFDEAWKNAEAPLALGDL